MGKPAREDPMKQEENHPELGESSAQGEERTEAELEKQRKKRRRPCELPRERELSRDATRFREKFEEIMCMEDNVEEMENFMVNYEHPRFAWLDLLLSSPSKNKDGNLEVDPTFLSFKRLTWDYLIMYFPDVIERELLLDVSEYVGGGTEMGDPFGPLHGAVLCGRPEIVHLLRDHSENTELVKKGICWRLQKYLEGEFISWNIGDCFGTIKRALLWSFLPNPVAYKRVARFLNDFEKAKDPNNDELSLESFVRTLDASPVPDEIGRFIVTVISSWMYAFGQVDILRALRAASELNRDTSPTDVGSSPEPGSPPVKYEEILQDVGLKRSAVERIVGIVSQIMTDVVDQKIPQISSPSIFLQVCSTHNLCCRVPASCLRSISPEDIRITQNSRWTAIHLAAALGDLRVLDALITSYDQLLETFPEELEIESEGKSSTKTMESLLRGSFVDNFGMTPLHHGVLGNHHLVVRRLLRWMFFSSHLNDADVFNRTAFQMVCSSNLSDAVPTIEQFTQLSESQSKFNTAENCCHFTPLHWATFAGATEAVRCLVQHSRSGGIRAMTKSSDGQHPHKLAEVHPLSVRKEIQDLLESIPEVKDSVDRLYRDRQVYVDGANAILIGASVIASVTFGGWLQLPLGDDHESTHTKVRIFWAFNSLSFFFAMGTVIAGAEAVLPQADTYIEDSVEILRKWLIFTAFLFVCSIICVLGAFAAAGFSSSSLVNDLYANMATTTGFGSVACGLLAITFGLRLFGIRRIQPKEDMVHNVIMQGAIAISKRLSQLGRSAPSKEFNLGEDGNSLTVVLRRLTKSMKKHNWSEVGDERDIYTVLRQELGAQLHPNPKQHFCYFRNCYRILASESHVQRFEWFYGNLLPVNRAMWRRILQQLKEKGKRVAAAGQPSEHFLFQDESGGFTLPSEVIKDVQRYGLKAVQKENVSLNKYLENINREARVDFRRDYENLGMREASRYRRTTFDYDNSYNFEYERPPGYGGMYDRPYGYRYARSIKYGRSEQVNKSNVHTPVNDSNTSDS